MGYLRSAIADICIAIHNFMHKPEDDMSPYFSKGKYVAAYDGIIMPVPDKTWCEWQIYQMWIHHFTMHNQEGLGRRELELEEQNSWEGFQESIN